MNKNGLMFKCFIDVMKNNKQAVNSVIPKMYKKNIYEINYDFLKKNKLTNLIFDIDNTILPVGEIKVDKKLIDFFKEIGKNFNICIVSNNVKERVLPVAKVLETGYLFEAGKPKKEAYDKALILLNSNKNNTVMIGDQMLSDIKGANEYGLYTIMVDPLSNKHDIKTRVSRILQKIMMRNFAKKGIFKERKYYEEEFYDTTH